MGESGPIHLAVRFRLKRARASRDERGQAGQISGPMVKQGGSCQHATDAYSEADNRVVIVGLTVLRV